MKKILYVCLALVVLSGVGIGFWLLRSPARTSEPVVSEDDTKKYETSSIMEAYKDLDATSHLADYESQSASLVKLETATNAVFFAPTKTAVDTFVANTALGFVKFLPYHIVLSDQAIEISDGKKLKTDEGQELVIVTIDGDLYVRDAKGNEARLRRPVQTKNGTLYVIDTVLLTQ